MKLEQRLAKLEARRRGAANREPEMSRDEILSLAARLGIDGEALLANPEYQESLTRELGMVAAAMQPSPASFEPEPGFTKAGGSSQRPHKRA